MSGVCFDPGGVAGVDGGDVFEEDVVDVFGDVGGVAHAADAHGA